MIYIYEYEHEPVRVLCYIYLYKFMLLLVAILVEIMKISMSRPSPTIHTVTCQYHDIFSRLIFFLVIQVRLRIRVEGLIFSVIA